MVVAQQPQRAQDVGVALAGDEVADGEDRRQRAAAGSGVGGTSVPRCTTRVLAAPSARARSSVPAELASTSRALSSARRTIASPRGRCTTLRTSPPWTEITSGTPVRACRTASPAGAA